MCCATSRLTSFSQDIDSVHGTPIPRATHQFGPFVWLMRHEPFGENKAVGVTDGDCMDIGQQTIYDALC